MAKLTSELEARHARELRDVEERDKAAEQASAAVAKVAVSEEPKVEAKVGTTCNRSGCALAPCLLRGLPPLPDVTIRFSVAMASSSSTGPYILCDSAALIGRQSLLLLWVVF